MDAPATTTSSSAAPSAKVRWRDRKHTAKNVVIAVALGAAAMLIAVRRGLPLLVDRSSYTDGSRVWERTDDGAVRYAVWDEPRKLPSAIDGPEHESRPALSPDGHWLAFAVGERGADAELYLAEMVNGEPRDPRP